MLIKHLLDCYEKLVKRSWLKLDKNLTNNLKNMLKTPIVYDKDNNENITEVTICFEDKFYNKTQKDSVNKKTQRAKRKKTKGFVYL